jgi:hypothetical protein
MEKLRKRFPEDKNVHVQWISTLVNVDPEQSLLELDKIRQNDIEFYNQRKSFLDLLTALSLENLGELEKAKPIYESLIISKSGFTVAAESFLDRYNRYKKREEEKIERINIENKHLEEKKYEVVVNFSYHVLIIIMVNIIFISIIIYLIYRQKKV